MSRIEKLILALAVLSIAVATATILSPGFGVAVVIGAIGQSRVERERSRRMRGEAHLLRALRTWRLYR